MICSHNFESPTSLQQWQSSKISPLESVNQVYVKIVLMKYMKVLKDQTMKITCFMDKIVPNTFNEMGY